MTVLETRQSDICFQSQTEANFAPIASVLAPMSWYKRQTARSMEPVNRPRSARRRVIVTSRYFPSWIVIGNSAGRGFADFRVENVFSGPAEGTEKLNTADSGDALAVLWVLEDRAPCFLSRDNCRSGCYMSDESN